MSQGPQWEPVEPPVPPPSAPGPMSLGQVIEVGRRILGRHWGVLLLVSLLFIGPGALLSSATALRFTEVFLDMFPELDSGLVTADTEFTRAELERTLDALVPFLGASLLAGVLGTIGTLGFTFVVTEDYHARQSTSGSAVRTALHRTPSAVMFMLVTGLLILGVIITGLVAMTVATLVLPVAAGGGGGPGVFAGLIIAVGLTLTLVYLTMRWAPAYPAMIEEDLGWRQALRRSWHLSGDNVLRIFALLAVVAILTGLVNYLLATLVFGIVLDLFIGPLLGLDKLVTGTIASAMAAVVVAPAMPVFTAVLFFDLRARRDAPKPTPAPSAQGPYL